MTDDGSFAYGETHEGAAERQRRGKLVVQAGQSLVALSVWLDDHNAHKPAALQMWERCGKIGEEYGEVVEALIALGGQNPRKPARPDAEYDVIDELLDVAVTAVGAVEHMTGNQGEALGMLVDKIFKVAARVGLISTAGAYEDVKRGL